MLSRIFKARSLEIPQIGLGTSQLRGTLCTQTLNYAISLGYKHFDTSPSYLNEHMIAISIARVNRNSLFITSKVSYGFMSHSRAQMSIHKSLDSLKTTYLDLALIEWPGVRGADRTSKINKDRRLETWQSLIEMKKKGLIKHIGVANFSKHHIEEFESSALELPEVNQIEFHPLNFNKELYNFCNEKKIQIIAHTPLARGSNGIWGLLDVKLMAIKYKVEVAQVILRWTLDKGIAVIPKSQNYEKIRKNSNLDFQLEPNDTEYLNSLNKNIYISADPTGVK
ncbi:hypothetical protein SteCoe_6301 [Stentor coeruleus]|uniref:NADP-dependent oxidoreductase domain-containing protein n=1 Tax=Stentor coeruleus TaxID=5963 RepID=A0A1R2CQI2_9CILI|nr:hypothetical protein SteCoe_6301 [Stentor coeruleus]